MAAYRSPADSWDFSLSPTASSPSLESDYQRDSSTSPDFSSSLYFTNSDLRPGFENGSADVWASAEASPELEFSGRLTQSAVESNCFDFPLEKRIHDATSTKYLSSCVTELENDEDRIETDGQNDFDSGFDNLQKRLVMSGVYSLQGKVSLSLMYGGLNSPTNLSCYSSISMSTRTQPLTPPRNPHAVRTNVQRKHGQDPQTSTYSPYKLS
jgi:hypothetical protein